MELSFDSVANLLKTNPLIGVFLVLIGLIWKFGPAIGETISNWFKQYISQKNDKIDKMIISLDTNNTRFFTLLENQGKTIETIADKMVTAINKVGDSISSMEKTLLSNEARVIEKITNIGSNVNDKIDKEMNECRDEIRDSKFETLINLKNQGIIPKTINKIDSKDKSNGDNI